VRLADLERADDGDFSRFVTRVPDVRGVEEFEFRVAGLAGLVEEVFADATIELTVDSTKEKQPPSEEFEETWEEQRRALWDLAALADIEALLKPSPPPPERDSSVFTTIRPVSGEGSYFRVFLTAVVIPAGASLFAGAWMDGSTGGVTPASGDQDMFLNIWPPGPSIIASRNGGTRPDVIRWSSPFPQFLWFRAFGFMAGVADNVLFTGYSMLP
jgi:hypothetical protein